MYIYIVYMCVCVCARTHAHVVIVRHMHAATCTCTLRTDYSRPDFLASLERLTRVLETALGSALFDKDGHETQDAVAPAGRGLQLCTAERTHGQTG